LTINTARSNSEKLENEKDKKELKEGIQGYDFEVKVLKTRLLCRKYNNIPLGCMYL
jgi:uncharacterized protein (UPF0335 family)